MLDTSRVLLFVKSVHALDREKVGLLLETDEGLTADWAVVERVCAHFDKQREWSDEGSSASGPVPTRNLEELVSMPAGKEESRSWLETGSASSGVVKGPLGGAVLAEQSMWCLLKAIEWLLCRQTAFR